jgi:predicted alpha-1,2-mannosidase
MKKSGYPQLLLLVVNFIVVCCNSPNIEMHPVELVNPFVGTAAYGHTFPGAALPFGMVQLSPTTGASVEKAGYSYNSAIHNRSSETIIGFTHTNLSGTGLNTLAKYSNILFMPTAGELQITPGSVDYPESGYRSRFSRDNEEATPGYYKVFLEDYNITAELTVAERVGVHRYTFPETDKANIIIDITRESNRPEFNKNAYIEIVGENQLRGYTTVIGHATREPVTWYFFAEFSKSFDSFGTFSSNEIFENNYKAEGEYGTGAWVSYHTFENEEITVKVGISFRSMDGAENNLKEEAGGLDFEKIKKKASNVWNEKLNKIYLSGGTNINKSKFYTALYHSLLFPRVFSDSDGSYFSHFKDSIIYENDFRYYVDFSLWDTYRTVHPLFTIIEPERQIEMIKTFLAMFDQGGRIPGQVSYRGFYSPIMIGDHGSTVIVDSYMKGLRDFDIIKAYEGMRKNAFEPYSDYLYMEKGYVPADVARESVSMTLENAFVYWAIAQVARDLGKEQDFRELIGYAYNYQNLYDTITGFYRPRFSDGSWLPVCQRGQPARIDFLGDNVYYDCWNEYRIFGSPYRHYTESNAWQYLFYPQHDIQGLINLMGGRDIFTERLDGLFYTSSSNEGPFYVGVTGAIGQYIHGNEPSLHKAYLYNYAGKPWKTQERVRAIMETLYSADEWGLPGNDDMGTLSAWYVFSALGFYPVTPGQPIYTLCSPQFEKAVINLSEYYDNRAFTIIANNASGDNKYIQSVRLNGVPLNKTWISHDQIVAGGILEFEMGPYPNRNWGSEPGAAPPSMTKSDYPPNLNP